MSWALEQRTGSSNAKLVLMVLANCHNHHSGKCCPRIQVVMRETELSERSVQRAILLLEQGGLLRRIEAFRADGSRTANQYELLLVAPPPATQAPHEPEENLTVIEPKNGSITAHDLVKEFVDEAKDHDVPLPRPVIGHLANETKKLLDEGFSAEQIRSAYGRMAQRNMIQPSLLPNFMTEAALPRREPMRYGRGMTTEQILNMAREDR